MAVLSNSAGTLGSDTPFVITGCIVMPPPPPPGLQRVTEHRAAAGEGSRRYPGRSPGNYRGPTRRVWPNDGMGAATRDRTAVSLGDCCPPPPSRDIIRRGGGDWHWSALADCRKGIIPAVRRSIVGKVPAGSVDWANMTSLGQWRCIPGGLIEDEVVFCEPCYLRSEGTVLLAVSVG